MAGAGFTIYIGIPRSWLVTPIPGIALIVAVVCLKILWKWMTEYIYMSSIGMTKKEMHSRIEACDTFRLKDGKYSAMTFSERASNIWNILTRKTPESAVFN